MNEPPDELPELTDRAVYPLEDAPRPDSMFSSSVLRFCTSSKSINASRLVILVYKELYIKMNKQPRKEMTLEERIEFVKAKYVLDPNYKPPHPTVQVVVGDLSKITPANPDTPKTVISLITAAEDKLEQRRVIKDIERKLKRVDNAKVPTTIDFTTIKQLPSVIRSKTISGEERARFMIECIEWENTHPDGEGEKHFFSEKAFQVLEGWICASDNDKTELAQLHSLCKVLFASKHVKSDVKIPIATSFFAAGLLDIYPELFHIILQCKQTRLVDRSECCKFLYHSNNPKYMADIEKHLIEIIESDINDDIRYEALACFVTTTGIASAYLSAPIPVSRGDPEEDGLDGFNQQLLTRLFYRFVKTKCALFYVIMSCEFLLEQKADPSIHKEVAGMLLKIATDKKKDVRTRADAADVILNHPDVAGEEIITMAQNTIQEIGEEGQTELEKTVYSNKENVHMLNDTFKKYIEESHKRYIGFLTKMSDLTQIVEDIGERMNLSDDSLFKVRQSMDRIMVEPTLHTSRKVSTSTIFCLIFYIISQHSAKEQLEERFLQELEDMANTCSTGHAKRLVNVMIGFTDELEGSIDIVDQFVANIKARLMATIRNMKDEDQRDALLEAMASKGAEKEPFNRHIKSVADRIEEELKEEFIVEGWISAKKFGTIFKETIDKILM